MSQFLFGLFLFLLLVSHASASGGPFSWLPLPLPFGQGWQIGILSLLPAVVIVGWWLEKNQQISQIDQIEKKRSGKFAQSLMKNEWTWGETAVTIPLAAFSLLVLLRLSAQTAYLAAMIGLCWFVYLFLVNHPDWRWNWLWRILAMVLLVQGVVAIAQFFLQRELGLTWLGEPTLDLLVEGTSVAQRDGQNWLRAYGLNSHPNQLGLLMMALCLLLWPNRHRAIGAWRWLFWLGLASGLAGLLVSLSRSALLGLLLGGLIYGLQQRTMGAHFWRELVWPLAILGAGVLLFALFYGDVVAGRLLALNSPLEIRSLWERQRDFGVAWQLLWERPFLGIGLGQYLSQATAIDPDALMVHNVPLLIGVELGALGLVFWLFFWGWPLWRYGRLAAYQSGTAVWLALILMALLHPEPALYLPKDAVLWGLAAVQWQAQGGTVWRPAAATKYQRLTDFSLFSPCLSVPSLCNSVFRFSRSQA